MYNQQGYQSSFQNQMGANTSSQYRGYATKYQPVGYVQSQYNQSLSQGMNNQQFSSGINPSYGSMQSAGSYHTANYRGNQPGHDAYLRADSTQPAQSQYGIGASQMGSQFSSSYSGMSGMSQPFGASNPSYGQYQNPQSFHTANYRGNQPGHDAYLRADSTQPAQSQYGIGASQMGMGTSQMGSQLSSSYSGMSGMSQQFGAANQQYGQYQNPQSYHTANYRGDQQGHDAYLRADSTQPAQSQFGMSAASGMNRYQM